MGCYVFLAVSVRFVPLPTPDLFLLAEYLHSSYTYATAPRLERTPETDCIKPSPAPVTKEATFAFLIERGRCRSLMNLMHELKGTPLPEEMFDDDYYIDYWKECMCALDTAGVEPGVIAYLSDHHHNLEAWEKEAQKIHARYKAGGDVIMAERYGTPIAWFEVLFLPTQRFLGESAVTQGFKNIEHAQTTFLGKKYGAEVWDLVHRTPEATFYDDLVALAKSDKKFQRLTPYWTRELGELNIGGEKLMEGDYLIRQPRVVGIEHGSLAEAGKPDQGTGNFRNYYSFTLAEKATLVLTADKMDYAIVSDMGPIWPATGRSFENVDGQNVLSLEPGHYRLEISLEPTRYMQFVQKKPIRLKNKATLKATPSK